MSISEKNIHSVDLAQEVYSVHYELNSKVTTVGALLMCFWIPFDWYVESNDVALKMLFYRVPFSIFSILLYFLCPKKLWFKYHIKIMSVTVAIFAGIVLKIASIATSQMMYLIGFSTIFFGYAVLVRAQARYFIPAAVTTFVLMSLLEFSQITEQEYVMLHFFYGTIIIATLLGCKFSFSTLMNAQKAKIQLRDQKIKLGKISEERMKLIRVLSHDLSNGLTIIQGKVSRLKKSKSQISFGKKNDECVDSLYHVIRQQVEIIDNVRNELAIKTGKLKINFESVSSHHVYLRALTLFKDRFDEKSLIFKNISNREYFFSSELSTFSHHVMNNIISNAIKFSYEKNVITFNVYLYGDNNVAIEIRDFGVGIPENLLSVIFEVDKKTSRVGTMGEKGTGFGMPLVKSYVEKFNGKIEIETKTSQTDKNTGTLVRIIMPRHEEDIKLAA